MLFLLKLNDFWRDHQLSKHFLPRFADFWRKIFRI